METQWQTLVVVLILSRWLTEIGLELLNMRHVRAHAGAVPEAFRGVMDEATYARSVGYTLAKGRFNLVADTVQMLWLLPVLFSGVLPWVYQSWLREFGASAGSTAFMFLAVMVAASLVSLPLDSYATFRLEQRFGFNNSTPRSHEIAAQLIGSDLVVDDIYKLVYENTNYHRVVIHGTVMARTRSFNDGKVVASWLALDDFTRIGATEVDADGAIRNLSCIKGIEAAILFKEVEGGKVKISFRSTGKIDVMEVSRRFNGGGHRNAAGAQIDGKLEDVMQTVVAAVAEALPTGDNCNA